MQNMLRQQYFMVIPTKQFWGCFFFVVVCFCFCKFFAIQQQKNSFALIYCSLNKYKNLLRKHLKLNRIL